MKVRFVLWFVLLLVILFPSSSTIADSASSCQICHTNEGILKSLFKPPAMKAGGGEG